MRTWIALSLLASPVLALGANIQSPMSAGDITCPQYLALENSPEAISLRAWVAGRVAATVPADFQSKLRKIPLSDLQQDLHELCIGSVADTNLFEASALLAYGYQKEQGQ
jgi:hypothetical protein